MNQEEEKKGREEGKKINRYEQLNKEGERKIEFYYF